MVEGSVGMDARVCQQHPGRICIIVLHHPEVEPLETVPLVGRKCVPQYAILTPAYRAVSVTLYGQEQSCTNWLPVFDGRNIASVEKVVEPVS